jgi:hypothetical protein
MRGAFDATCFRSPPTLVGGQRRARSTRNLAFGAGTLLVLIAFSFSAIEMK